MSNGHALVVILVAALGGAVQASGLGLMGWMIAAGFYVVAARLIEAWA